MTDLPSDGEAAVPEAPPPAAPEPTAVTAPVAGAATRTYDLPGASHVVSTGLLLAARASSQLRRASLYIGLLTLALLGPPVVYVIEVVAHFEIVDADTLVAIASDPATAAPVAIAFGLLYLGIAGAFIATIDGQLIGVALLGATAADRPFTLRQATIRARQVFWRLIRGGILTGLVVVVIEAVVILLLYLTIGRNDQDQFVATIGGSILTAPLGYLTSGIVLGDVGALEALRRSVRLARARPRIALVVAVFTILTAAIQTFALSAGLDLLLQLAGFLHVGVTGGVPSLVVVILGVLALVMALGSLAFTVAALVAAPQVAAFLGLTYFAAGLDRASEPTAGSRFRWVTRPMVVLIGLVTLASAGSLAALSSTPAASDTSLTVASGALRPVTRA